MTSGPLFWLLSLGVLGFAVWLLGGLRRDPDRARALQQLALIGSGESVPVVARLLGDAQLAQYARDALEQMPGPAAGAAAGVVLAGTGGAAAGVLAGAGAAATALAPPPIMYSITPRNCASLRSARPPLGGMPLAVPATALLTSASMPPLARGAHCAASPNLGAPRMPGP